MGPCLGFPFSRRHIECTPRMLEHPRMLGTAGEERARFPPGAVLWRFVRYRWDCSRGCGEGRASRGPGFKGEYQLLEPLTFRKSKKIR